MTIDGSLPPFSQSDLAATEAALGAALPDEFVSFLRRHNGGIPTPSGFYGRDGSDGIETILGIGSAAMRGSILNELEITKRILHPAFAPVATNGCGDVVCLGLDPAIRGRVFLWLHELWHEEQPKLPLPHLIGDEGFRFLAVDFPSFVGLLSDHPAEE